MKNHINLVSLNIPPSYFKTYDFYDNGESEHGMKTDQLIYL